jgi:alkanesulfonate monooxygenase SsuD/methylene tetrahydromethanopterin reductase-like flavin-dependent oxidoreductase (luciferase family)
MSDAPSGFRVTWDQQLDIARQADAMGLEALVPVGRWTGFGGNTHVHAVCYETYTWAAGLAQATTDIEVFCTTHLPVVHPVAAAKMATTIDHISGGRFGMNLVMGWFTPEMELFGTKQNEPDNFDFVGKYFNSTGAHAYPKPLQDPRPVLLNAGASPAGQRFSARNVDVNLIALPVDQIAAYVTKIKDLAQTEYERNIDVWTYCLVICRETEREAKAAYQAIVDQGDWPGAQIVMDTLGIQSESFASQITAFKESFLTSWGGPCLVGTPEQVAEQFGELSDAGMGGAVFGFHDYVPELRDFGNEVLPLLKKYGLRL